VAISYMAAESGHQITECRKCIVRDLQSASCNPQLLQEIATSFRQRRAFALQPLRNDTMIDFRVKLTFSN
jgi:hypothetical protein